MNSRGTVAASVVFALLLGCGGESATTSPDSDAPEAAAPRRGKKFAGRRMPVRPSPRSEHSDAIEQLEAIGYAAGSREGSASGVTRHDVDRAQPGLNLYTSGHAPVALLMDMEGRVRHRWRYDYRTAWPDSPIRRDLDMMHWWRRVHLFENGDLLAIFGGLGIVKINRDSELLWANPILAHHHLEVLPDGRIYVLTRESVELPDGRTMIDDLVTLMDENGVVLRSVSLHDSLGRSGVLAQCQGRFLESFQTHGGDLLHANTLQVLDGRHTGLEPGFAAGNLLVSLRSPSFLMILDPASAETVWTGQGEFRYQHESELLSTGHLLLFDNCGLSGQRSRILEVDPLTKETLWEYTGSEQEPFYTEKCGAVERLPNGNTLITESENGRAFEVTLEGDTVWEFHNPHRVGEGFIAILPEMHRISPESTASWLGDP